MWRYKKQKKTESEKKLVNNKIPLDEKSLRKISNSIVISGIVFFAVLAILAIHGNLNPTYQFIPAEHKTGALLASVTNGQISSTFIDKLGLQVVFTTTSLSAQNPINVNAKLYPPQGTTISPDQWITFPDHFYLIFPHALDDQSSQLSKGLYYVGTIRLDKSPSSEEYDGSGIIKYQFEGDYTFSFIEQKTVDSHTMPNGAVSFDDMDLNQFSVNASKMHVSSSDATTNLYVGSIGTCLTFVLIGFGIIETRDRIHSIVKWYLLRQHNEQTQNQSNEVNTKIDEHE